jgi:hypothetical protein
MFSSTILLVLVALFVALTGFGGTGLTLSKLLALLQRSSG